MRLGDLGPDRVAAALRGDGIVLRIPPVAVRVRGALPAFAAQLGLLYADYEVADARGYADIDVRLVPGRRLVRPTVRFVVDGIAPFEPYPLDHALPMFEWGVNWVFAQRMQHLLLLHCAVVARGDRAVLLPAWPGSGKSTLAASLAARDWRFFSDEFGLVGLDDGRVHPFVRPAALKNASIDVIRAFAPDAFIGPVFPNTRKGSVAHFRPPQASVREAAAPARIAAVVFPNYDPAGSASLAPLEASAAFLKLAHNAFNYEEVGEAAFRAVAAIVRAAPCRILTYGTLDQAHGAIDALVSGHA